MKRDYSNEIKEMIRQYKKESIEYGKDLNLFLRRLKVTKEEIDEEILKCDSLSFTEKQIKENEIRYALFFVYSKRKGRKYVITFREPRLRIITTFPLGKRTLRKYRKKGLNI
ncbi:MAG: hypothetical protein AABY32_06205 [Nanoarchaeota archaeon]